MAVNDIVRGLIDRARTSSSFYEKGWLLYTMLQAQQLNTPPNSVFFDHNKSDLIRKVRSSIKRFSDCFRQNYDETLGIVSNTAAVNAYQYLWGLSGGHVFLRRPEKASAYDVSVLVEFERRFQEDISADSQFNSAVRDVLKHGIDYGVGYLVQDGSGGYRAFHPLTVFSSEYAHVPFYIIESWDDNNSCRLHFIVPKDSLLLEALGLSNNNSYQYCIFSCLTNQKGEYYIETSVRHSPEFVNYVPISVFKPFFYGNEPGVPIGCGTMACAPAFNLQHMSRLAFEAQAVELRPPALAVSGLLDSGDSLAPGSIQTYDAVENGLGDRLSFPVPPRGANSVAFVENCRNDIRKAYFPDAIASRGVGQTTAIEASRTASAASNFLASLRDPFHTWFLLPILRERFAKMTKSNEESRVLQGSRVQLIGGFTEDLIATDLSLLNVVNQAIQAAAPFSPTLPSMINFEEIMRRLMNRLPPEFVLNRAAFDQAKQQMLDLAQQQQEAEMQTLQQG